MPLIIGVTGAIATGKSTVCDLLQRLGAVHCDADKLVHRLYEPGMPGFGRVVSAFGHGIIGADGLIDRRILGSIVFGKPQEMTRLTTAIGSITPAIEGVVRDWRSTLPEATVAVLEAVNMIEPGYSALFDQTWLVACETALMRRRLAERNQLDEAEVERRLGSQRPWQDRAPAADVIIHNDGDLDPLGMLVASELARAVAAHRSGKLPESRWFAWRREQEELRVTG